MLLPEYSKNCDQNLEFLAITLLLYAFRTQFTSSVLVPGYWARCQVTPCNFRVNTRILNIFGHCVEIL
jgi:hypothetical protein